MGQALTFIGCLKYYTCINKQNQPKIHSFFYSSIRKFSIIKKGGHLSIAQLYSSCHTCHCNGLCVLFEFNEKLFHTKSSERRDCVVLAYLYE